MTSEERLMQHKNFEQYKKTHFFFLTFCQDISLLSKVASFNLCFGHFSSGKALTLFLRRLCGTPSKKDSFKLCRRQDSNLQPFIQALGFKSIISTTCASMVNA